MMELVGLEGLIRLVFIQPNRSFMRLHLIINSNLSGEQGMPQKFRFPLFQAHLIWIR